MAALSFPPLPRQPLHAGRWPLILLTPLLLLAPRATADEAADFFEKKIRPVLAESCYRCHSSETLKPKAGLRLDRRDAALAGGESGPAIVPGKPDESLLIKAVTYTGGVSEMPPDGKLPAAAIANLREWIERGAYFPPDTGPATDRPRPVDIDAGRKFWSFQPVQPLPSPAVRDARWPLRKIDAFVLAQLDRQSLAPSPVADPRVLLRRLSFDLRGLPPSYDEVLEFAANESPDAYDRWVDRYLASPTYGERWGRHWLDVARYAEDNPTSEATCKPPRFPYRYRDWVVEALNADLPYDEFVRRQLAADLIGAAPDQYAALGFLGLSPVYHKEPKLSADVIAVIVADEWDERLDTITRGFLGLTVACARCHDHKFDPIRTEDYYALAGILASTQLVEWPLVPTSEVTAAALTETQRQIVDTELRFDYAKKMRDTAQREGRDPAAFAADATREEQRLKELKASSLFDGPIANAVRDAGLWLDGRDPAWTILDYRPHESRDLPVFLRGNTARPGALAPRRFLEVLAPTGAAPFALSDPAASGRRELAAAIVQDAGSLAARVMVNRVWGWHVGRGLVTTPSNFGRLGDVPTHPELLDDLAARFIRADWSLKWLHREIVHSATWRQSSRPTTALLERDPDNRQLGRMNRRQLEPEPWRDAVLAVGGRLDFALRGPSRNLDDVQMRRRAVYGTISRQKPADLLRLFDFPDAKSHCEVRVPTTTPLQQLYLLNSPFVHEQAAAIASELAAVPATPPADSVRTLFRRILARNPTAEETAAALALVSDPAGPAQGTPEHWTILTHSLLATNEFLYVE